MNFAGLDLSVPDLTSLNHTRTPDLIFTSCPPLPPLSMQQQEQQQQQFLLAQQNQHSWDQQHSQSQQWMQAQGSDRTRLSRLRPWQWQESDRSRQRLARSQPRPQGRLRRWTCLQRGTTPRRDNTAADRDIPGASGIPSADLGKFSRRGAKEHQHHPASSTENLPRNRRAGLSARQMSARSARPGHGGRDTVSRARSLTARN